jgi:hypothetical protein
MRVMLPDDAMQIDLEPGADSASVRFNLLLEEEKSGEWQPTWQLEVLADLRRLDGDWLIHRTSHKTLLGARPR